MSSVSLHWRQARFDALGVDDLYAALQLRCRAFILEQGPYLDPDGWDQASHHLLGRQGDDWRIRKKKILVLNDLIETVLDIYSV